MIAQTHRKGFGVQACKYVRVNHSMTYFASLKSAQICLLLWLADPKPQPIRSRTYKWAWHLCEKFEPSPGEKGLPWPHCMKLKKVWRKSGESLEKVWISLKKVWRNSEHILNLPWTYSEHTLKMCWIFDKISKISLNMWLSNMDPRDASASKKPRSLQTLQKFLLLHQACSSS